MKPFDNCVANSLIGRTRPFPINQDIKNKYGNELDLLASIRSFYLLLPIAGMDPEWRNTNKTIRRNIIKKHLESVCEEEKISSEQVQVIDKWLQNKCGSRDFLLQVYGYRLEEKYGPFCFYCGNKIEGVKSVDHIFPFSKGGDDEFENFILVHRECNSSKNSCVPGELMRWASESFDGNRVDLDGRLKFLIFLRDNFTCTTDKCRNGLLTQQEITITKKIETGIAAYDNLTTICKICYKKK